MRRSPPLHPRVRIELGLKIHRSELGGRSSDDGRSDGFPAAAAGGLGGRERAAGRGGGFGTGGRGVRVAGAGGFVGALVLLHVVFAREGFVAGGAGDVFFARVLFAVAGGVAGGGEGVGAGVAVRVRAGVLFLDGFRRGGGGGRGGVGAGWCGGGGRGGEGGHGGDGRGGFGCGKAELGVEGGPGHAVVGGRFHGGVADVASGQVIVRLGDGVLGLGHCGVVGAILAIIGFIGTDGLRLLEHVVRIAGRHWGWCISSGTLRG